MSVKDVIGDRCIKLSKRVIRFKHNGAGAGYCKAILVAEVGCRSDAPDIVQVGWSMCSPEDVFDRNIAYTIASNRAFVLFDQPVDKVLAKIPWSIKNDLAKFVVRCKRYFKGSELPAWCEYILQEVGYYEFEKAKKSAV